MGRKFLMLLCFLPMANAYAQKGSWKGELDVQGIKLPLVFNFTDEGCTLDSPAQGVNGINAEKTVLEDNKIRVAIPAIGASYEGENFGDSIRGTFRQNGMSLPLTLRPGVYESRRPQTPTAPFPYQEEYVHFTNGKFSFNGTLTLPKGYTKNTPVVLMVTGSGQQNRDEEIFGHKPFAVIADAMARRGIASLRYDDRGFGDSTVKFMDYTTDDFKQDAEAGIKILRDRFEKVGVLGHSEGGTIALMLAAERKTDFAVSLAGMAISGSETLLIQNRQALSSLRLPAELVNRYCSTLENIFMSLKDGKDIKDIKLDTVPIMLKPILDKAIESLQAPYMRHFLTVDVGKQLPQISCPVLALNGEKDTQVYCEANLKVLKQGLSNCKHTILAINDLNHLFQHCKTGSLIEYQQIEETVSPNVLEMVTAWINAMN